MKYVVEIDSTTKRISSYRPQTEYEIPVLYAYLFRGAEWIPVINKNNMVTELKFGKGKVAVKPNVPEGADITIITTTKTAEEGEEEKTITEIACPLYKQELGALPEGGFLTDKACVFGIDGYRYLAGDEPTEKPASMRIEEIKAELAKIDREYRTPRTLAEAAQGNEYALNKLAEADSLSEALRAELRELL